MLHNCVSQLRRELGDDVIETHDSGYLLRIAPASSTSRASNGSSPRPARPKRPSSARFSSARHSSSGAARRSATSPTSRSRERDPRLDELHRAARQDLIDAQLELGHHADVVGELESLVEEHPFDERLRGQLMLALYRSGSQADALDAYQDARRALVDDLGLEPGVALRELEQAILRQDPSLDLPAVLPSLEERRKTVTVLSCEVAPAASGLDPEEVRRLTATALSTDPGSDRRHGGTVETSAATSCSVSSAFRPRTRTMRCGPFERRRSCGRSSRTSRSASASTPARSCRARVRLGRGREPRETAPTRIGAGEVLLGAATLRALPQCRESAVDEQCLPVARDRRRAHGRLSAGSTRRWSVVNGSSRSFGAHTKGVRGAPPGLVAVVGEPGIGKTRLVRELVADVGDKATVLVGRCVSYGQGATFFPLARWSPRPGRAWKRLERRLDR